MNDIKILVVDDDPQMQLALKTALMRKGYQVHVESNGVSALSILEKENFSLIISDQRMPEMGGQELLVKVQEKGLKLAFIMITAHGTIDQAVKAMQLGAADFITKPFSVEDLIRVVERVLNPENQEFRQKATKSSSDRPIITNDPLMIRTLEVAEAVAKSDATVLVQGESGTGKELIARLIHFASPRAKQPFVAVNCAALPSNLLESELFGHEKGSFTGAQQRKIGKFELAHGGTILLDEISEMDVNLQAKLLRVLQEREVDRVGGSEPISIDVRVVATTNRNLEEAIKKGVFREDLFYRLSVIPLTLPSLRARKGDVRLLAEHFVRKYLGKNAPALTTDVIFALENHSWPGNVRELQNAVERAAILSKAQGTAPQTADFLLKRSSLETKIVETDESLTARQGVFYNSVSQGVSAPTVSCHDNLLLKSGTTVSDMEKALILETLKSTANNRTKAAQMLGISIRTLRNKLNEYRGQGLQIEGDDSVNENSEQI